MNRPKLMFAGCLAIGALLSPGGATAEPSSFAYVGGGAGRLDLEESSTPLLLQVDTGYGSPATSPLIVAGLFNFMMFADHGADIGASLRITHPSYVLGDFGAGLDVGFYQRFWGGNSTGGSARVVLGAPYGVSLSAGAMLGTNDHKTYFATLGIDFARMTVHRTTGLNWWRNPYPPETARR